jgi:hypothetical protein
MKILPLASIALLMASAAAFADEITIAFDSPALQIYPPGLDATTCETNGVGPLCVAFTGSITDNDMDDSEIILDTISASFTNPSASGYFTLDNTYYNDVPGLWIGDPTSPLDVYTGPIFGLDIAPGTPWGVYTGTIELDGENITNSTDLSFISPQFTVRIVPEPSTDELSLVPLSVIAVGVFRRRAKQVG